jgi:hypothetical protein
MTPDNPAIAHSAKKAGYHPATTAIAQRLALCMERGKALTMEKLSEIISDGLESCAMTTASQEKATGEGKVKLPPSHFPEDSGDMRIDAIPGHEWLNRDDVIAALAAAGVEVEQ